MRAGLRRLIALHLGADLRRLRKGLPGLDRLRLQYAKAPKLRTGDDKADKDEDIADELTALILDRTFVIGQPPLRDQAGFLERLDMQRPRLASVANEVCALAGDILARYQGLRRRLSSTTQINWIGSVQDIQAQLDRLVFRGFLQTVPYEHLQDYPRYLRAVEYRLERLGHAAAKDQQWMREMADLQQRWSERHAAARAAGRHDPRLEEIRWMLEELRVSLFAQQLGTAYPVSVKRIQTRWRDLGL